jgi:hypothetical protein
VLLNVFLTALNRFAGFKPASGFVEPAMFGDQCLPDMLIGKAFDKSGQRSAAFFGFQKPLKKSHLRVDQLAESH